MLAFGPLPRPVARWLGVESSRLQQGHAVAFVGLSLAALLLMFLLVAVNDPPGERFVGFAAWMLVGLGLGVARHATSRAVAAVLALLLAGPIVVRAIGHLAATTHERDTISENGGERWLPATATLLPSTAPGTRLADGRVVVAEPLFVWQRQRLERGEGRH